jgi:hypothetical protein
MKNAIRAHTTDHLGVRGKAIVTRHARKNKMLITAYPITWPDFRR